jgi:hypothetical protein
MKTLRILGCLTVLVLGAQVLLAAAPIPTAPIHTNKLKFRIPFHYDSAELSRLGAREIRLYASRDRGRTWQQTQAVTPDAGKFNFQATSDGEYWFIVRTLDARNHLHPDGNITDPGLMVIVDTTPPRLELELRQPSPGKVELRWSASDEHLDATQLRLEYLQPGSAEWQTVSVVPKPSGQTEWTIPQGGVVSVRGSIADFARNVTQDQAQLRIAPAGQTVPRQDAPGARQPVAGPDTTPRDNLALTLPEHFPSSSPADLDAPPPVKAADAARGAEQLGPVAAAGNAPIAITPKNSFVSLKPDNRPAIGSSPREPSPPQVESRKPTSVRQRVVGSRKFQIGYKLQDVGPSGVAGVELYITQDNGATWYRYGSDDDNQSPIHVEVPRAGTYGFALGVRSGAGLASDPPQNGDAPAIVVVVDQTPPQLELLPFEFGRGKNNNKLLISWKCTDDNLDDRPVSLFYSTTGEAPWLAIAQPVENSGSYLWTVDPSAMPRFYLRIEARDAAGNTQTIESQQPVVIDLSRPTAKIIDVESPAETVVPRD